MAGLSKVLIICLAILSMISGCTLTHVSLKKTKELVIGRTMELGGTSIPWNIWTRPKRERFGAVFVGVRPVATDGMNTAGLTISAHTFHQAHYQTPLPNTKSVDFLNFVPYLLERFQSVREVTKALETEIRITGTIRDDAAFIHWAIQDRFGMSCVVEYVEGELHVHNITKVGTMTNDPDYTWHLRNLNQYAALGNEYITPVNQHVTEEVGVVPMWISHGLNLLGVPGDLGPPGRFVRSFFMKELAVKRNPPSTLGQAFALINQLLNAVAIPIGSVSPSSKTDKEFEFTQWSLIKVPSRRAFYVSTYYQPNWKLIDLHKLELDEGAKPKFLQFLRNGEEEMESFLAGIESSADSGGFEEIVDQVNEHAPDVPFPGIVYQ